MPEKQIWAQLKKGLPEGVAAWRIEARHPPGWPDVEWAWSEDRETRTGFLELKDGVNGLRSAQAVQMRELVRAGVECRVVARKRGVIYMIPFFADSAKVIQYESAVGRWTDGQIDHEVFWTLARGKLSRPQVSGV